MQASQDFPETLKMIMEFNKAEAEIGPKFYSLCKSSIGGKNIVDVLLNVSGYPLQKAVHTATLLEQFYQRTVNREFFTDLKWVEEPTVIEALKTCGDKYIVLGVLDLLEDFAADSLERLSSVFQANH